MIFDPAPKVRRPLNRRLYAVARPLIERSLRLRGFNATLETARRLLANQTPPPSLRTWLEALLGAARIDLEARQPAGFHLPERGALIAVANRPFGLLDACLAGLHLARQRADLLLLAPTCLAEIPELAPWILPFESRSTSAAAYQNLASLRAARRHLQSGGALLVFPAAEVARWQLGRGIVEGPWQEQAAELALATGAAVLPMFLPGRNSLVYQTAGLLHRNLSRSLLPREFCARRQRRAALIVGQLLTPVQARKMPDAAALTRFLRLQTLLLGRREIRAPIQPALPALPRAPAGTSTEFLLAEVRQLQASGAELARSGSLCALIASAKEIPRLLREIGRQREIAFRLAGEGTGKEIDLDRFDPHYLHLFLWDEERRRLVGAYRMGLADQLLARQGPCGLYTSTLFKFKQPFLDQLGDAVEMGRSFIVPDYQRAAAALPLLWKGISLWVAAHPRYRKLFGPVSISQDYHHLSQHLMVTFLKDQRLDPELAAHVKARHPFKAAADRTLLREIVSTRLHDMEDCSALIATLEADNKGLPVLLKHYLRLNGTLLSFNVDPDFASVVDGLILVDLTRTDPRLLAKYMGAGRSRAYLAHHGLHL